MGLSEEEKAKHPFFQEKRFKEIAQTKEFKKAEEAFHRALQDFLYEELKANFKIRNEEPSVHRVIEGTMQVAHIRCQAILNRELPLITQRMLERFGLIKEE